MILKQNKGVCVYADSVYIFYQKSLGIIESGFLFSLFKHHIDRKPPPNIRPPGLIFGPKIQGPLIGGLYIWGGAFIWGGVQYQRTFFPKFQGSQGGVYNWGRGYSINVYFFPAGASAADPHADGELPRVGDRDGVQPARRSDQAPGFHGDQKESEKNGRGGTPKHSEALFSTLFLRISWGPKRKNKDRENSYSETEVTSCIYHDSIFSPKVLGPFLTPILNGFHINGEPKSPFGASPKSLQLEGPWLSSKQMSISLDDGTQQ